MSESCVQNVPRRGLPEPPQGSLCALQPHVFSVKGKWHVFDPESGRFFRINEISSEILRRLSGRSIEEVVDELKNSYESSDIDQAVGEITSFVNRGLLFPEADSDQPPQRREVRPRTVSVTLNVASVCNLDCIYCWNKGGAYGRVEKQQLMDYPTARRAIDLMIEHSRDDDELLVDFYGGEPLLNFEVIHRTMKYCKTIEKQIKRRFSYKVTTNGLLLTKEKLDFFNEMGISLGISIDGVKKVHNRNRPKHNGDGSYDQISRNFDAALKYDNIHVSTRATLIPPDLSMVNATKAMFRMGSYDTEVEFASESCEVFNPRREPLFKNGDYEIMKDEYLRFAKFYLDHAIYKDDAIDVSISNSITRVLHESHKFSPCGAGNNFLTVSEEGDLYPCIGFVGMPTYRLGSVKEGIDLERLADFRHRMVTVVYKAKECSDCWARYICAGNCPANNEQYNQNLWQPYQRGCDWLKFQLEVAMWIASEINQKDPSRLKGYEPV